MFMGMSIFELIIISFFIATSFSCVVSYAVCAKVLTYYEIKKNINKSINKLRRFDQYILSKITLAIALFYFFVCYIYFNKVLESSFSFFFACLISFVFNVITTFFSRISYCYVCNVILETKLNEIECFFINFMNLLSIYLPFIVSGFVVSFVYLLNISDTLRHVMCISSLVIVVLIWIVLTPKIIVFVNKAKKMKKNHMLRYRMEQLFDAHGVKRYELYYWDTSKSKEANAMVSGFFKCNLFVASYLIENVTLPELESIVIHEIGHIKNNHLFKMMIGKAFMILSIIFMVMVPYWGEFNDFYKVLFYILTVFVGVLELLASICVEKRYELEADSYANSYSDPSLFESALKKVSKYEDTDMNTIEELFQSHPDLNKRIDNLNKNNH